MVVTPLSLVYILHYPRYIYTHSIIPGKNTIIHGIYTIIHGFYTIIPGIYTPLSQVYIHHYPRYIYTIIPGIFTHTHTIIAGVPPIAAYLGAA